MDRLANLCGNNALRWGRAALHLQIKQGVRDDSEFRRFMAFLADPHRRTGVSSKKVRLYGRAHYPKFPELHDDFPARVSDLLEALCERVLTGHRALEACWHLRRAQPTDEHAVALDRLLDRNLDMRVSSTVLRKLLGMDRKHPCSLGKLYSDKLFFAWNKPRRKRDPAPTEGTTAEAKISRKYDGLRATLVGGKAYSRTGHELKSLAGLAAAMPDDGLVYDGEACVVDDEGNELFQEAVSMLRRDEPADLVRVRFYVFDVLTREELHGDGTAGDRLGARLARFRPGAMPPQVRLVEQVPYTAENMLRMRAESQAQGWEGLIVRRDARYVGKRSNDILKVKVYDDDEFVVREVRMGEKLVGTDADSRRVPILAAFAIEHKGKVVWVGSGFTDEQRRHYAASPHELLGREVTVQYFGETEEGSLRHPVCKVVHPQGGRVV